MLTPDLVELLHEVFDDARFVGGLRSGDGTLPWPPLDVMVCVEEHWFAFDSTTVVSGFWKWKKSAEASVAPARAIQLDLTIRGQVERRLPAAVERLCSRGRREMVGPGDVQWDLEGTPLRIHHELLPPRDHRVGDERFRELERLLTSTTDDDWMARWDEGERALDGVSIERSERAIELLSRLATGMSPFGGQALQRLVHWGEPAAIPIVARDLVEQQRCHADEPSSGYPSLLRTLLQRRTLDAWAVARDTVAPAAP
jgi:hypothetical protein